MCGTVSQLLCLLHLLQMVTLTDYLEKTTLSINLFPIGYEVNLNGVFPLWAFMLMAGIAVAIVVALTSRPYVPPVYHAVRPLEI